MAFARIFFSAYLGGQHGHVRFIGRTTGTYDGCFVRTIHTDEMALIYFRKFGTNGQGSDLRPNFPSSFLGGYTLNPLVPHLYTSSKRFFLPFLGCQHFGLFSNFWLLSRASPCARVLFERKNPLSCIVLDVLILPTPAAGPRGAPFIIGLQFSSPLCLHDISKWRRSPTPNGVHNEPSHGPKLRRKLLCDVHSTHSGGSDSSSNP